MTHPARLRIETIDAFCYWIAAQLPMLSRTGAELRVIEDAEWLRAFVTRLTTLQEQGLPEPWQVTDAPERFVASMLNGIVGLEMPIRRIEGKWKLSQNRHEADQAGTIEGLKRRGDAGSAAVAEAMLADPRQRRS